MGFTFSFCNKSEGSAVILGGSGEKTQIPDRLEDLIQIFGQKNMGSSGVNNCLKGCCFKVITGSIAEAITCDLGCFVLLRNCFCSLSLSLICTTF